MSAMTEIPAKTPSPMGRTDNFFPGSAKAAVADPVDCAAAAVTEAAFTSLRAPTAMEENPFTLTPPAAADVALEAAVMVDEAAATVLEATDDAVLSPPAADVAAAEVAAAEVATAAEPVTVVKPFTEMASPPDAAVLDDTELVMVVDPESAAEVLADEPESTELEDDDEPLLLDPLLVSRVNLHLLTSSTASLPLLSLIGVKVITQVSVIGPAEVMVL